MQKKILVIILLAFILISLNNCSIMQPEDGEQNITSNSASNTIATSNTDSASLPGIESTMGISSVSESTPEDILLAIDINKVMKYTVPFFHEPFNNPEELKSRNILYFLFLQTYLHSDKLDVEVKENGSIICVPKETLVNLAQCLLDIDVINLSEYHNYMSDTESYDDINKCYYFCYARDSWKGDNYYCKKITNIEIRDGQTIVTADIVYYASLGIVDEPRAMVYVFNNITFDGNSYYKLKSISVG